ncbi:MAG: ATP-binding protein [Clostridiales bacterium]|nr:ATP-binding protein [uncultured Intestinibacter sp.]MDU1202989.1 ATP-binding protein [Clostridiales bacterium]
MERGIVIERQNTYFKFSNPGSLRISIEEAMNGGISDPRNVNIFKMFNLIGVGERAGSGLENIRKAWKEQEWETPNLNETYNPDRVELILSTNSLLPKESVDFIKNILGDEYNNLDKDEKMALVTAHHEGNINNRRLQILIDNNSIYSNKILSNLVKMEYLESKGKARGTKYILSKKFDSKSLNNKNNNNIKEKIYKNNNDSNILTSDEIKIIEFIENKGYITNAMARENLGFGSTKVKKIFNKLMNIEKINKEGNGPQTRYILNKNNSDR